MGNQNVRTQENVPLAQQYGSENYQPQMGPNPAQPIQLGIPVIQSLEIGQIPQQAITNDLKDQPFHIQKKEIIKALIIYLIMQLIQYGFLYLLLICFSRSRMFEKFSLTICLISCICCVLVVISGKFEKFQQNPRAIINSFLIIVFSSSAIISYCHFLSRNDTSYISYYPIMYLLLLLQSIANFIVIGLTILYLLIEKKQVRFEIYILMLCSLGLIVIMIQIWLLFFVGTALMFGTILMIVLQQLMNGRFQLKKNQSFGLCNAIYLGLMVPCNIF